MPVAAKQYDIETETIAAPPAAKRRATRRHANAAPWSEWESLVEHFGNEAVLEPSVRVRPERHVAPRETAPAEVFETTPAPRRITRHRPLQFTVAAAIMWSTLLGLLVLLLGLHGATLALSQKDIKTTQEITTIREDIDNTNKSIAAVQVSPQMAQWAMAHGWHVADQTDFDEVPAASTQTEAGGQR